MATVFLSTAFLSQAPCFSDSGSSPPHSTGAATSPRRRPSSSARALPPTTQALRPLLPSIASPKTLFRLARYSVLIVLAVGFTSCSAKWTRPDVPVSQQKRDEAECRIYANQVYPNAGGLGGLAGIAIISAGLAARQELFDDCMTVKGYVKQ